MSYRWGDAERTHVIRDVGRSTVTIPAFPENRDFAALLDSGTSIEPHSLPPPSSAQCAAMIEAHIDAVAKSRGYASGISVASYAGSSVAKWAAESTAFVAWRDAVWLFAHERLAAVQAGSPPAPATTEALIAELPVMTWPK